MDWNSTYTLILVIACLVLYLSVRAAWHFVGRLRLQRRTEARLHEEGKKRLLRARDKVKAELRTNGAGSSAPPPSPGPADGRSR